MSADDHLHPGDAPVQTGVSVYLGDGGGTTLEVVCDGVSQRSKGSIWERAVDCLARPSPRGPFAVAKHFMILVYETRLVTDADHRFLETYSVKVSCDEKFAYASVGTANLQTELAPLPYLVGDDVVTISRSVLTAASRRRFH